MVKRQVESPAPGPVSAIAARKAKQNPFRDATISKVSQHTLPPNQDKENYGVPPPAKKQKIELPKRPPEPSRPKKNSEIKFKLPPRPVPQHSQSFTKATGSRNSPVNLDSEEASDEHEAPKGYEYTKGPSEKEALEDGQASGAEESAIGDSDSGSEIILRSGAPNEQLSTFVPTQNNVIGETHNEWTILLFPGDSMTLLGQYDVWVRKGAINILGAVLHASSRLHRVYAPSTHSLPSIRSIPNPYGPQNLPAEIMIISCGSRLRLLKHLSPKFGRIWNHKHVSAGFNLPKIDLSQRSFVFLKSSADDPHKRPLRVVETPLSWGMTIARILSADSSRPMAIMLCGPKGSGKSTLCRILANSLLTRISTPSSSNAVQRCDRVAFLDLDLGQPEFSPPGEISLVLIQSCNFGPPFTHPTPLISKGDQLIRAHHIGAVTPKDNPNYYLICALNLWNHYRRLLTLYPSCPLIINCSGWVQGSGFEILRELVRCMSLSHIVYTSSSGPHEVVESLNEATNRTKTPVHLLMSQPSEFATRTAADLRMMQTLSYFHLDELENGNARWDSSPINEMAPLVVHYAGPAQAIFGIMVLGEEQDPENLITIIAGCVVGLVAIEDDSAIPMEKSEMDDAQYTEGLYGVRNEDKQVAEVIQDPETTTNVRPQSVSNPRLDLSSDSDSDHSSISRAPVSFRLLQLQPRNLGHNHSEPAQMAKPSSTHLYHPSISRTPEGLPYISPNTGFSVPLDPSKSQSLGQALVRGINAESKTLHLITPIPVSTLQSLHEKRKKIVLVRGKLDTPIWAYREELVAAAARRRRRKDEKGEPERLTPYEIREWAKGVPWARVVDGKEVKSQAAKVWRVRRHLRTRVTGGEMSD